MEETPLKRLDPWDELPEDKLAKVRAVTEAIHKATDSKEANLETDTIKVPGQNWACVSFVSPTSNQKCQSIGMKIRGCFEHRDEAVEHVKRLIRLDPTFDIFICDMYNWCLVPPDPEMVSDQTYQDETLNGIISEYRKNQIYAKEHFEERKREMVQQAADEARRAALRRIEEESQGEMIKAEQPLELSDDETRIRDITEISEDGVGVSASEIMESMVGEVKLTS
jgi:excinuclease UvrABC nuclease subunit